MGAAGNYEVLLSKYLCYFYRSILILVLFLFMIMRLGLLALIHIRLIGWPIGLLLSKHLTPKILTKTRFRVH